MRYIYILFLAVTTVCIIGCQQRWQSNILSIISNTDSVIVIDRYDRIESRYVTTGDFTALQEMNTKYPEQTRTLIEDVIRIGRVNDPEINTKFLVYFQDSTLVQLVRDVQDQYANMDDVNNELQDSFKRLQKLLPGLCQPKIYAQIGSFDQSIIVGNTSIGVCLDKYLGADYQFYLRYYSASQRSQMTRSMIVPDILSFYILSIYPMPRINGKESQIIHDIHMSKIFWIVNRAIDRKAFNIQHLDNVERYMKTHKQTTAMQLLTTVDYKELLNAK